MDEGNNEIEGNIPVGVWLFHAVWLTGLLVGVAAWVLQGSSDRSALIQTYILALTLLAVAWYTFETRRMQRAVRNQVAVATRQTNVSILPIFILQVHVKGDPEPLAPVPGGMVTRDRIELTNVGNGSAFNVEIESLELKFGREQASTYPIPWLVFERVMKIDPQEKVVVPFRHRMEHAGGTSFGYEWPVHCSSTLVETMHLRCKTFSCYTLSPRGRSRAREREQAERAHHDAADGTHRLGHEVPL